MWRRRLHPALGAPRPLLRPCFKLTLVVSTYPPHPSLLALYLLLVRSSLPAAHAGGKGQGGAAQGGAGHPRHQARRQGRPRRRQEGDAQGDGADVCARGPPLPHLLPSRGWEADAAAVDPVHTRLPRLLVRLLPGGGAGVLGGALGVVGAPLRLEQRRLGLCLLRERQAGRSARGGGREPAKTGGVDMSTPQGLA